MARRSRLVALLGLAGLVIACGGSDPTGPSAIPELPADRVERVDRHLERLAGWGFSGAVTVARGEDVLLAEGYGFADREIGRRFTAETVFTIGSITKSFTAAAVLRLEADGLLSTDDPLSAHFDDVPEDKQSITLHHLLTHSSGLPGGIGDDFEPLRRDEFVDRALATELAFEPGSGYRYSNVGYSLLGIVVEQTSGRDYERFLHDELLLPAGMEETGYRLPGWKPERIAVGYRDGSRWGTVADRIATDDGPYWNLKANGGLHSTLADMHRWFLVLRGGGVLPTEQHLAWVTPWVDEPGGHSAYGYGWVVRDGRHGKVIEHDGGNGVFAADFLFHPQRDLLVFVATNSSRFEAPSLTDAIVDILLGEPPPLPPEAPRYDPAVSTESRAGRYEAPGAILDLDTDGTRLVARPRGQIALDRLFRHSGANQIRFARLDELAAVVFAKLAQRREDAYDELHDDRELAAQRTADVLRFIDSRTASLGPLRAVERVGTIAPTGRYPLPEEATAVSLGVLRFESGRVVLSVTWDDDDRYVGTAFGPRSDLPVATLVPSSAERFAGWIDGTALETPEIVFFERDGRACLRVDGLETCRAAGAPGTQP